METRAALEARLREAGACEEAVAIAAAATAPDRHCWRVAETLQAAREAAGGSDRLAAVLLILDLNGSGGPQGMGRRGRRSSVFIQHGGDYSATVRMSWARRLGKGRRQAIDGGAWMAAAEEALALLRRNWAGHDYLEPAPTAEECRDILCVDGAAAPFIAAWARAECWAALASWEFPRAAEANTWAALAQEAEAIMAEPAAEEATDEVAA